MNANRFGPDDDMQRWTQRVRSIMDEMLNRNFCSYRPSGTWSPAINVYELPTGYLICVELAGLDHESITVEQTEPHTLTLAGQRTRPINRDLQQPHSIEMMEIDEGPFVREVEFALPVDAQTVEMAYDRGYLWITLKKIATP
ncbi:MAG: Hsp20/alpha crystallin family protein [Phycisphaerales bacterium]|nr:Hsp20/alpha crystallin family protein [Phycisphaerales bacterium]